MTDTLLQLAERCEAATGDDATALVHLEMDICSALGISPEGHERPFVTSLDAAMTLVPEGWHIFRLGQNGISRRWYADAIPDDRDSILFADGVNRETPALALCAASLKARAAQGGEQ